MSGSDLPCAARLGVLLVALLASGPRTAGGGDAPGARPDPGEAPTPKQLFESYCGACHSLELPRSQQLDRAGWEWVLDDMISEYGASWITPEEKEILLDYLVEHHGPERREGLR